MSLPTRAPSETPWIVGCEGEGDTLEEAIASFENQVKKIAEEKYQISYAAEFFKDGKVGQLFARRYSRVPKPEPLSMRELREIRAFLTKGD